MFYYISGKLACLENGFAVIDAMGVGYRMTVSQNTAAALSAKKMADDKNTVKLYCHMAVREDGIELFGFHSEEEMESFRMLIGVSGVGPKAAISILSLLTPAKLAIAIRTDDKKTISKANNVGPKTAARIVLELKDKLKSNQLPDSGDEGDTMPMEIVDGATDKFKDARDALTVLGYSRSEAEAVLKKLDTVNAELDDIIREALKKLMK